MRAWRAIPVLRTMCLYYCLNNLYTHGMKTCTRCKREKPESEFRPKARYRDGLNCYCLQCEKEYSQAYNEKTRTRRKICCREYYRKHKPEFRARAKRWQQEHPERYAAVSRECYLRRVYGMKQTEYHTLLEKQGGGCAICKKPPRPGKRGMLHVDHDHQTGAVRGLLCQSCNHGIGNFLDSVDLLACAAAYLTLSPT